MRTLADYINNCIADNISESILSSTRTGKAGMDEDFKKYRLDPDKVTLNTDGSIDYNGNVNFLQCDLTKLPFKFRKVNGHFNCSNNMLTTLEGCPIECKNFLCAYNKLTSLEHAPAIVNGVFDCVHNKLTSLEGSPEEVKYNFFCSDNQLTSLNGGPKQVGSDYDCSYNKLTSLEGLPKKLDMKLYCGNNATKFTIEDVLALCKIRKSNIHV